MPLVKAKIRAGFTPHPAHRVVCDLLRTKVVDGRGITFSFVGETEDKLSRRALKAELEFSALSIYTLLKTANHYSILPCGALMGDRTGPVIVAKEAVYPKDLEGRKIATVGTESTAFLLMRLMLGSFDPVTVAAGKVTEAVLSGEVDAGIVSDDERMGYEKSSLRKVADLGEWFGEVTGLPLPVQIFGVKKVLGRDVMRKTTRVVQDAIIAAFDRRKPLRDGPDKLSDPKEGEWIERSLEIHPDAMSRKVKEAIQHLAESAHQAGLLGKKQQVVEYVHM